MDKGKDQLANGSQVFPAAGRIKKGRRKSQASRKQTPPPERRPGADVPASTHLLFFLPSQQGTNVLPFLHSVHRDPTQFKSPDAFDPAHFLDGNGAFRRRDAFMPFSAGKRLCLGEALARMELFLFLTTLLQRFTFQPTCPREQLDLSPLMSGIGSVPRPYAFRALSR